MQWIKITDMHPRSYTPVLCMLENPDKIQFPLVCYLSTNGEWLDMRGSRIDKHGAYVSYWMTIPNVPVDNVSF